MSKHPLVVTVTSHVKVPVQDIAKALSGLRYDKLRDFMKSMSDEFEADGYKDKERGRDQLSRRLMELASILAQAKEKTDEVWKLCQEHEEN